jgi:hypothetical protein
MPHTGRSTGQCTSNQSAGPRRDSASYSGNASPLANQPKTGENRQNQWAFSVGICAVHRIRLNKSIQIKSAVFLDWIAIYPALRAWVVKCPNCLLKQ